MGCAVAFRSVYSVGRRRRADCFPCRLERFVETVLVTCRGLIYVKMAMRVVIYREMHYLYNFKKEMFRAVGTAVQCSGIVLCR